MEKRELSLRCCNTDDGDCEILMRSLTSLCVYTGRCGLWEFVQVFYFCITNKESLQHDAIHRFLHPREAREENQDHPSTNEKSVKHKFRFDDKIQHHEPLFGVSSVRH